MLSFQKVFIICLFFSVFFYPTTGISQPQPADSNPIAVKKMINEQTLIQVDNQIINDTPQYKYYDVEIILFKHNNDAALQSEYWNSIKSISTDDTQASSNNNLVEIKTDVQSENKNQLENRLATFLVKKNHFVSLSQLISPLTADQLILTKQAEQIKYSKNYHLLTHLAWSQAGLSKEDALPLRFIFDQQSITLSGEIKIILSRFLHAEVNFNLIEEVCRTIEQTPSEDMTEEKSDSVAMDKVKIEVQLVEQQKPEEKIITEVKEDTLETICQDETIQFKQSRKMRSKQLHYLDHPVFGLLIQINPTKIKQELQIEQVKP
jgi:Peptidoglycan-binding protein, CsiV